MRLEDFKMKKNLLLAVCLIALFSLGACAQAGGKLTGTVWVLDNLNGAAPVPGTTIFAIFADQGNVGGSAGCNNYSSQYTISGSNITISAPMAATMMACPQPVMDQENAYFQALDAAKSYAVKGDQLTLKDGSGKALASYKAQSQSLAGTSWLTIGYNNGKQAVTSVMAGTELTAVFGKDGNLTGSSGCNTFSGSYKTDGDKITIGPLASTRMYCGEPAGVMDQESQYLAALQSAATYKIEGTKLELRTADGALAADFQQK
jgi:heat shock protein HslJ